MESTTEKYPVCRDRNTTAAFRWFYQPLSMLTFRKARPAPRPRVPAPAAVQSPPEGSLDRG